MVFFSPKLLTFFVIYAKIIVVAVYAQVAELADAQDLKSCGTFFPCRFDPGLEHQKSVSAFALADFYFVCGFTLMCLDGFNLYKY